MRGRKRPSRTGYSDRSGAARHVVVTRHALILSSLTTRGVIACATPAADTRAKPCRQPRAPRTSRQAMPASVECASRQAARRGALAACTGVAAS